MGEFVIKNAFFRVGTSASPSTDLWPYVRTITIDYLAELHDRTAMGNTFRKRLAGLKDWSATVEFNQDYANSLVDEELFDLVGTESSNCWMCIRPTTDIASNTNPRYYGRAILESYSPVAGTVGEFGIVPSVTFQGDGILTRAETTEP